jgi:hypothetical protein
MLLLVGVDSYPQLRHVYVGFGLVAFITMLYLLRFAITKIEKETTSKTMLETTVGSAKITKHPTKTATKIQRTMRMRVAMSLTMLSPRIGSGVAHVPCGRGAL